MRAFIHWLARRTEGEKWLTGALVVVVGVLIWVWNAWKRDLDPPMATEVGTVADWVAAVGTILAIVAAAVTFWKGVTANRRAEAQRVVTTWHTQENREANLEEGEFRYLLVATVYNFASTPVRDVSLLLDVPADERKWSIGGAIKTKLQVIAPGRGEAVEFPVTEFSLGLRQRLHMLGLNQDTIVEFYDSSGFKWRTQQGETTRIYGVEPSKASEKSLAATA